ncbi:MAG: Coenzyme F420 hydrogenase/dehydrogenase, beta subunit C-terminal domain [Clostridia bacterium]|nr:Coenzyme F420 hydrogenase/dehydrogenase, beta subunit C-terminal domain [Clostridia bacterium]MBO5359165.1 Coenzyme F420 hydrogenase/dehydrogenase, beta subunit C-terminal domain [Clostridia bacterium]
MINITDAFKCSGCHSCVNICPKKCIDMASDSEGFLYPKVNSSLCINCGLCEKACPIINSFDGNDNSSAFAAVNKNDIIRLESSSGGIFTLLAENVLEKGGVVFGAAFTDDFKEVTHIAVTDKEHLYKLRGSKYLQSRIGDTYKQAEDYLKKGICVYFSGTPCQIAGLHSYLGKEYQNLYTQDLICHGVPSPFVWKRYLELREQGARSRASNVFFRQKNNSWKNYDLCIEFENGAKYEKCASQDTYMRGFLFNLYLRPSCYACGFKSVNRCADITLADFWGIQNIMPDIDDDKGISLVVTHSKKGNELLKQIARNIILKEVSLDSAIKYNPSMVSSAKPNGKRKKFFKKKSNIPIDVLIDSYLKVSVYKKVFRKIKRYIKGK